MNQSLSWHEKASVLRSIADCMDAYPYLEQAAPGSAEAQRYSKVGPSFYVKEPNGKIRAATPSEEDLVAKQGCASKLVTLRDNATGQTFTASLCHLH
jgi:hypothetical protein